MVTEQEQLQMKLALENRFRREVKKVFAAILQDFRVSVAAMGVPPDSRQYAPAWSTALDVHYRRTQKLFKGVVDENQKQVDDDDEELLALLLLGLLAWRERNVQLGANFLLATTQTNMSEAIRIAKAQFDLDGIIPTNRELAAAATAVLRKKFNARTESSIITETQKAAESTKQIEAEVRSGVTPRVLGGGAIISKTIKTWTTVGDSRVRDIHVAANGQRKTLTEPFVVGGELLMFPGDSSMGASAGNIANCRCSASHSIV